MDDVIPPAPASVPSPAPKPPHYPRSSPADKKKGIPGWMWVIVAVLGLGVALLMMVCMALMMAIGGAAAQAPDALATQVVEPGTGVASPGEKLVEIDIRGIIMSGGGSAFGAAMPFDQLKKELKAAREDAGCKGVLLRIDSPGGSVTASDVLYNEIRKLRDAKKIVVAIYEGVAASGAVYCSAPADHIIAHPTTLTGSIGVLIQSYDVSELVGKMGIRDRTVKSGARKDMLSMMREMKPDEREILQTLSDEMHARFISIVAEGRGLDAKKVRALADGRIYSANQAKANGLIDSIGYHDDAVKELRKLAKANDAPLVRYRHPGGLLKELMGAQAQIQAPDIARTMRETLGELMTTRLMYLWRP